MWHSIRAWLERRQADRLNPRLPQALPLEGKPRVLAFAPHPDDETLGCGGTLALLAQRTAVKVILVTDGAGAGGLPEGAAQTRQAEFIAALAVLGVADYELWDYPDGSFHDSPGFQARLADLFDTFKPDWLLFPSPLDYHPDHLRLSLALQRACAGRAVTQIHYEVWSPVPATHYVDIGAVQELKLRAFDCHRTAAACGPYRAAIAALNGYRGLYRMDRENLPPTEAFCVDEDGSLGRAMNKLALRLHRRMAKGG